ncbi:MAG TPA: hypothetical protein VIW02_08440, partial [Gammaproteobacteria bacterium]
SAAAAIDSSTLANQLLTVSGGSGAYSVTDGAKYAVLAWNADAAAVLQALQTAGIAVTGVTKSGGKLHIDAAAALSAVAPAAAPVATQINFVAGQLAVQLAAAGYTASASGSNLSVSHGTPFSVAFVKQGGDALGSATVSGTPASAAAARWSSVDIALTGTAKSYEDWTVTLNNIAYTHHVALGGQALDGVGGVGEALEALIDPLGNYQANYAGGVLTISTEGDARANAFTATVSVVPGTAGTITETASNLVSHALEVTGATPDGLWKVSVIDTTTGTTVYSGQYNATGGGASAIALGLADDLRGNLPTGYGVSAAGGHIVVSNVANKPFSLNLNRPFSGQAQGVTLSGVANNQAWAVNLVDPAGTVVATATHVSTSADAGLVAAGLAASLTSALATAGVTGSGVAAEGASLVVNHATNNTFDLVASTGGTWATPANPVNHDVVLSGTPVVGQVFAITHTVGGTITTVSHEVTGTGDTTLPQIAALLKTALETDLTTAHGSGHGYTVAVVGNSIAVSHASESFTLTNATVASAAAFSDVITLSGTPSAGQWWQVNVLSAAGVVVSDTAKFTWPAVAPVTGLTDLEYVAEQLANTLNGLGSYDAVRNGTSIAVTGSSAFTLQNASVVPKVTTAGATAGVQLANPTAGSSSTAGDWIGGSIDIGAPASPSVGDVWQITIADNLYKKTVSYTWKGNENPTNARDHIAAQLQLALGGAFTLDGAPGSETYTASRSGSTVTIKTTYGNNTTPARTFSLSTIGGGLTSEKEGTYLNPDNAARTLTGAGSEGQVYALYATDTGSGAIVTASHEVTAGGEG